ncbi:hypothetical protein [Actinoplanes couchii]|uniref:Uncharacterized protein n=1 Tax=Actinoplanes couchii TaxID=403638 RepID=A0ABQ3XPS8_9ACTN|nr:hypothetical protein [Actinoplanes couchii]MDR6319180.1 hypothetical protein [Actinoplanes couchii]GID60520.1 hypothetical protein Aco03nite_089240 [Actinoplanes couchii]
MTYEDTAERVIDRLLLALAAQQRESGRPGFPEQVAEVFAELSRDEAGVIFGQAGHLVHYGVNTEPLVGLVDMISAVQRGEAPEDAALKPGDSVRIAGDLPENLADHDEAILREMVFVVRHVGSDAMVDVQPDLLEDYVIETVPIAILEQVRP